MVPLRLLICAALFAYAAGTEVQQCKGRSFEGLSDAITLKGCRSPPCVLKRGRKQHVEIDFVSAKDVSTVVTQVYANVLGVNLPFVDVDNKSICNKLYTEDGEKTSCPVVAGKKYKYKDSFPIMSIYPQIPVGVHWELVHNKEVLICFEVDATIQ
nr:venom peptide [Acharia stimulea]